MQCPECKHEIPENSKFCNECGCHLIKGKDGPEDTCVMDSERKHVTVMFSDLSGYTKMTERLDPEEVKRIMSQIFGKITEIIKRYDGFIERFIGDAVMAVFGVPIAHEDDPIRAIRAAMELHTAVEAFSPRFEENIGQPLAMHTGINTGLVVTGEVDVEKGTHGLTGDAINLASRIGDIATAGEIVVGPVTYEQTLNHFEFEILEPTKVKGKQQSVNVYKVRSFKKESFKTHRLKGLRASLTGRNKEMAILMEGADRLKQGQGSIISIYGDAGTGKSRLKREFKETLDLKEFQWREGHAYSYTQNMPYFPMINLLTHALRIEEGDPPERVRSKVEAGSAYLLDQDSDAIPYIGSLFSLNYPEIEEISPEYWKDKLQESIIQILTKLTEKGPTIVCFEDLHWADPSFIELLHRLLKSSSENALFICTFRSHFSLFSGNPPDSTKEPYNEIHLEDLKTLEAQEMLSSLLDTTSVPRDLSDFVQQKTEGNPFYLEEMVNSLIESGILTENSGNWTLTREITDSDISPTVQGVITARVDRLERESKRILQEASVIGRSFYYEILKRITDLKANLKQDLVCLERLDLINTKSVMPDLEYLFKHALTQEVVYNCLLKKERREIHERIGSGIEELFKDRLPEFYETLAFHFKRSRSVQKAVEYLMKSGEKSLTRYALEESHQYYREAYDLLVNQPRKKTNKNELRIDLLNKWALVYYYRGDFRSFANLFEENVAIADSVDSKSIKGMFYAWLGAALTPRRRFKESLQYFRRALKIGEEIQDKKLIGFVCSWLPWTYTSLGLLDDAIVYGKRAQDIFKILPEEHYVFFKSLAGLGWTYYYRGEKKKVLDVGRRLVEFGRQHSNIRCHTLGYWVLGLAYSLNGELVKSIEYMKRSIQTSADPFYAEFPRSFLGVLYVFNNQWKEAEDSFKKTLQFCDDFGVAGPEIWANIFSGVTHVAGGQMTKGTNMIKETRLSLLEDDLEFFSAFAEYALGSIYLQMVEKSEPVSISVVLKNIGFIVKTMPFASKKAENHLIRVIEIAKSNGSNYFLGLAYMDLGRLYKLKKRKEKARDRLLKAIRIFDDCEMEGFLNQAKDALDSLE